MLAKQYRRFLRNLDSLCARVLKACYFPMCGLLEAKCGSRSSCVWRSLIIWGKAILLEGSRWRIGDGSCVNVLKDPWIPKLRSFKIYDQTYVPPDINVIDLKGVDGEWDVNMINCLFNSEDVKLILSLPCSGSSLEDKLRWHYTKNGEYSVKSG